MGDLPTRTSQRTRPIGVSGPGSTWGSAMIWLTLPSAVPCSAPTAGDGAAHSNITATEGQPVPDNEEPEVTRAGLFQELAGKAKEAAGELVGNEELADHGREQQADAEADTTTP